MKRPLQDDAERHYALTSGSQPDPGKQHRAALYIAYTVENRSECLEILQMLGLAPYDVAS